MVTSEPSSAELAPRDAARQLKGVDPSTALLEPRFQAHLRPLIRDRALRHDPGSVPTLLDVLDGTPDFRVLRAAAEFLMLESSESEHVARLRQRLRALAVTEDRWFVAVAPWLLRLRAPRALERCAALLHDETLRGQAMVALLLARQPEADTALIGSVEDLHLSVGLAVCRVCELQPEVLARLVARALGDPSPSVRNEGVRACVRLPTEARRSMLLQAAIDEPDPFLRRAIEAALGSVTGAPPAAASC
jgi:HEAT repeat protein